MCIRTSLNSPRLIPQGPKVYSLILTSMTLRELELMTIGEQIQSLTIELPLRVIIDKFY